MEKIIVLLTGDFKNIFRDRMYFFILLSPLLMGLGFKVIIPLAEDLLSEHFAFSLQPHYSFIMAFALMLIPMVLGTLIGFMILEERDQGIISYFSVTPLSKTRYLIYKLIISMFLSIISSIFILYFLQLVEIKLLLTLPVLLLASLEAPLMALVIAAFADNKVEGFAFSKGSGIFYFAPLVGYLLGSRLRFLAGVFPTFWIPEVFLTIYTDDFGLYLGSLLAGFVVHLVFVYLLLKRFGSRID